MSINEADKVRAALEWSRPLQLISVFGGRRPESEEQRAVGRARMGVMDNRYTGVFEQVGDWWVGHVEELPGCNVQERSLDEARESLREAVQLIVQANRDLARRESEGHAVVRESLSVPVE